MSGTALLCNCLMGVVLLPDRKELSPFDVFLAYIDDFFLCTCEQGLNVVCVCVCIDHPHIDPLCPYINSSHIQIYKI